MQQDIEGAITSRARANSLMERDLEVTCDASDRRRTVATAWIKQPTVAAVNPALQVIDFKGLGAPGWIRTSDLWLRRTLERQCRRPSETACLLFSRSCVNWSQPATAPSRRGLSVICQSSSAVMAWLEAGRGALTRAARTAAGRWLRRGRARTTRVRCGGHAAGRGAGRRPPLP